MHLKRSLFPIALVLVMSIQLQAQYASVTGVVREGDMPLEYANIGLKGTTYGASSDADGNFRIEKVPYGSYTLVVSMVGYETIQKEISLSKPSASVNFFLRESVGTLEEVVISATLKEVSRLESPVPVEVYTHDFFKANPTPSVFEGLQNINGVRPQVNCNICNTGDIHINGLEGPYTMVLIDGMPIVSGLSTVYGLTGIPQSLIERVEVVKGPASTLYGSEAVGGVINIITRKPISVPVVSADLFATTWGEVNVDIGTKFRVSDKVTNLAGINYFNYQHPVDNNGDGFTDITLQDRISVFNKVSVRRKRNKTLSVAGRYLYEDRWGGQMNWTDEYRGGDEIYGESIYTSRWELMGTYDLPTEENLVLQVSANGHKQNSVYGTTDYLADQYIGFGQLTWNRRLGHAHDLLAGVAYRYTYYDDNTPATDVASVVHLPGLFVQDEISLHPRHKVLLGMRYDYNSIHGSILSPRFNYKWTSPDKFTVLRLSAGNGFRVANVFTEDHAALTGARQVVFVGDLAPERSWNVNINALHKIYTDNGFYIALDGSAFYTHFSNRIIPDYESNPNQIRYANLDGYAVSKGVSLNTELSWPFGLVLNAGATLMDVSITEEGETFRQLLTERFTAVWSVRYTIPGTGVNLDYTGNLYSPMRLPLLGPLDPREEYSPWFSIQNIQVSKSWGNWEVYGGVKNLLNFTPPDNSIARPFDPFDRDVDFDENGQVIPTESNPYDLTFDPTYIFAPNQGIRGFAGVRFALR